MPQMVLVQISYYSPNPVDACRRSEGVDLHIIDGLTVTDDG